MLEGFLRNVSMCCRVELVDQGMEHFVHETYASAAQPPPPRGVFDPHTSAALGMASVTRSVSNSNTNVEERVAGGFYKGQLIEAAADIKKDGKLIVTLGTMGVVVGKSKENPNERIKVRFSNRRDGSEGFISVVSGQIRTIARSTVAADEEQVATLQRPTPVHRRNPVKTSSKGRIVPGGFMIGQLVDAATDIRKDGKVIVFRGTMGSVAGPSEEQPLERIKVHFTTREDGKQGCISVLPMQIEPLAAPDAEPLSASAMESAGSMSSSLTDTRAPSSAPGDSWWHGAVEYSHEELIAATESYGSQGLLGRGRYGRVYKGMLRNGTEVAVKVLKKPNEAGFREEVDVLSRLRHPNLVILMGYAKNGNDRFLVYELLSGGDLGARLKARNTLQCTERFQVCQDAALGLSYLHSARPQVFHRDIKPGNILMDRSGTGKLADFGMALLAKTEENDAIVEHAGGTIGYADPLYIRTHRVTEKSEVYSFGIVLLEVLTNTPPALQDFTGKITYNFHNLYGDVQLVMDMLDDRTTWPHFMAEGLGNLALECIQDSDVDRPLFSEVVTRMRRLFKLNSKRSENSKTRG